MRIKTSFTRLSRAFTLVELAIVITILGLLIASVTAGTALVAQAKIRAVISEMQEMQSRVATFEGIYNYKPGDFPDASKFWGTNSCKAAASATNGANGDGDGLVKFAVLSTSAGNHDTVVESYLAWCHLHEANLGPTTKPLAAISAAPTINTNIPGSKLRGAGYVLANGAFGFDTYQHALILGAPVAVMTGPEPVLTPKQAYAIDKKLDDGMPETGIVRAKKSSKSSGVNAEACIKSSKYNIADRGSQVDCAIAILVN